MIGFAGFLFFLAVLVLMATLESAHKRSLLHRERMKELEVEELRIRAQLAASQSALPAVSDTMVKRGWEGSSSS